MGFTQKCFIRKNTPELRKKIKLYKRIDYETAHMYSLNLQ